MSGRVKVCEEFFMPWRPQDSPLFGWRPSRGRARAVQYSTQTENPRLIELTLAVPRYPCRTFADRLREYRRERGWRQGDLARAIGVNKNTVRNWESGRSEPRLAVLGRKAVAIVQQMLGSAPGDDGAAPGLQPHSNHSSSARRAPISP